jgi:carbonyl reductase 1
MKRILVTGGNKGIGKAICERLLTEYSDTYVFLASRDASRGEAAVNDLKKKLPSHCADRLDLILLDTASDASVKTAAETITTKLGGNKLYGIVNNAGIIRGKDVHDVVNVNYFGQRRIVTVIAGPLLERPGGRIVNIGSASGPMFVSGCSNGKISNSFTQPWTIAGGVEELDQLAQNPTADAKYDHYGFSKALVSAYTWLLAQQETDWIVNSVTPGWIKTDMTAGQGATNPPSKGAIPPVWGLMADELKKQPTGLYYGSDCIRSPWHYYRGPGDEPYTGPTGP